MQPGDHINQKYLSYFTQCDLGSTLWLFLGLLYVMLFLYWFQQVLLCFPSVINHIHYFQVSLSCYPPHWGNRVEFHSPSKLVGLCGISISQFWQAAENGVQWLRAVIQPAGTASFICCFFFPLPRKSSLLFFCTLEDVRFYQILMLIQSTQVWPYILIFHFMKNRAKEAENGFLLVSPQNTSSSEFRDHQMH